jgi:transcription initiation factor TFIIH subunit 4
LQLLILLVAKTFVMIMLYMPKPLLISDLDVYVRPSSKSEKEKALGLLHSLYIATSSRPSKDEPQALSLTKHFADSLRTALTGGGEHQSFGVPAANHAEDGIDPSFLDSYARAQWEGILHYVVNSNSSSSEGGSYPNESVRQLLSVGKLVDPNKARQQGLGITQAGFTFLLQEANAQVWTLLLLWLEHAQEFGYDESEVLSFLFMLGSLELGLAYSKSTLTDSQRKMLRNLASFGLIYLSENSEQFYPTRLATTLTSNAPALRSPAAALASQSSSSEKKGFIVIETNYRLYAYTSSPRQIAVLSLFTKLSTRYPNMVSGRLTRESIRGAISHGITSDQIIAYLSSHAHPQMERNLQKGLAVLPPTVVDQIRLWQIENERMKATAGFLFKEFGGEEEYRETVGYADSMGVLVWRNDARRIFFANRHEALRDFIKGRKFK